VRIKLKRMSSNEEWGKDSYMETIMHGKDIKRP